MAEAVARGLADTPKMLPTWFLYDNEGSELFEEITQLPEYYLTRTERSILEKYACEMVEAVGPGLSIVEFGSGSACKTRLLMDAALANQPNLTFVPIDISSDFLKASSLTLLSEYDHLSVHALAAEYFDAIENLPSNDGPRLILFLGSNIGNLTHTEAQDFLGRIQAKMQPLDRILLGVDLAKDKATLEAAYNDSRGLTERFNKNLLRRVNKEMGGHFDLSCFRHHAPYDEVEQRIEMRLISSVNQHVQVDQLERSYDFAKGEFIHTEWSHKYTLESFAKLCEPAGLEIDSSWTDDKGWFSMMMLRPRI